MKLLVLTQAVDRADPVLSFFTGWVNELSRRFEKVSVVCLKEGEHDLPANVQVYSLGKENGASRFAYLYRFFRYAFLLRHHYDAVLVHQNQEYVLLGGWLWKLMGKKVFLWRNHYQGTFLTDIALLWCDKIFYTSKYSYTAKNPRAGQMPVGVDTGIFVPQSAIARAPRSVLFLARMAPSKRPEVLLNALQKLGSRDAAFHGSFIGDPLPRDRAFYDALKKRAGQGVLADKVVFLPGVPNGEAPRAYSAHEIFVNLSSSGMYDKTLFEAASCGCLVLASSEDFADEVDERLVFEEGNAEDLAAKLEALLALSSDERAGLVKELQAFAQRNSLQTLGERLAQEIV